MDHDQTLVRILRDVKSVLDQEKIPFWLEAGTLLGAIRNKGIIPWDGDVDIATFRKNFPLEKRKQFSKKLEKLGLTAYLFPEKIDIFNNQGNAIQIHLMESDVTKDHHGWKRIGSHAPLGRKMINILRLSNVRYYGKFKNISGGRPRFKVKSNLFKLITYIPQSIKDKFANKSAKKLTSLENSGIFYLNIPKKLLSKFKKIKFYDMEFNIPFYYEEYLKKEYGDWRTPPKDPKKWYWYEYGDWRKIKPLNKAPSHNSW